MYMKINTLKKRVSANKHFVKKRVSANKNLSKISVTANKHFVNKHYSVWTESVIVIYEIIYSAFVITTCFILIGSKFLCHNLINPCGYHLLYCDQQFVQFVPGFGIHIAGWTSPALSS